MRRRTSPPIAFTLAGAAFFFAAHAWLGAAVPPGDEAVALPPFIVEETAKGPPWRYGEAMGFEILSRCNDATTRRVVEAHHQLHELLAEVLPPQLQLRLTLPRSLILYDEELQPVASREVVAQLLRQAPQPLDDAPSFGGGRGGRGFQVPVPSRRYSFLPNLRLWDRDAMTIFMIVRRDGFDPDRLALTQDYVSFLVKSRLPALPPWFGHGFLALYRQITHEGTQLTLGPLTWISEPHTEALKKDPPTAPPVLPLGDFFAIRLAPRDPAADYEPVAAWQAQAQLFVRWGLDSGGPARRAALWDFVERSATAGPTEELFRACFGLDFAAARDEIAAYLPAAVRRTIKFRPARAAKLPPFTLRNAGDGQIARLKGDWERMEIAYVQARHPELAPKYLEQARRTFRRGYDRDERDPQLLAAMGLCEADAGNPAGARELLESAVRIGTIRPRANYELARLRLAEFRAQPAGGEGRLGITQAAEVLGPLFAARAQQPPLPEVYALIGEVWAEVAAKPSRGHLAVFDEGVRLFPRRADLALRAAELFLREGFREEAANYTEIAARVATDEATRERAALLQRQMEK